MSEAESEATIRLLDDVDEPLSGPVQRGDVYGKGRGGRGSYEEAISATGYGRFHMIVLALCGWAVSSDAIEVLSVSFLLPSAACDFGLSSTDKGNLNSVIFVGMIVGGYFWGSLADKAGRRTVLLGSLTVNGLGGLASSFAQSFWLFLLLRFISGVGVGGSIPVIFSYFTEFQPKERRGMMISVLATFWMFGNIIAAGLAWIVIPLKLGVISASFSYDSWRIFVAVCTIPSLTSAAIFYLMPESPKFLVGVGQETKAVAVLRKIHDMNKPRDHPEFPYSSVSLGDDDDEKSKRDIVLPGTLSCCTRYWIATKQMLSTTVQLFKPEMRSKTIVILITNFTLSFGYYGLWMWFPEIFARMEKNGGSPCDVSLNVTKEDNITDTNPTCQPPDNWVFLSGFLTATSNLPGNILTIFLMDRIGRKVLLASSMVVSGGCVFFILFVHNKVENLLVACLFGAVSTIGWNSLDVLGAELFPTTVRSTAFGLQSVFGRTGAILGNQVFGLLVEVYCAVPMILIASLLTLGGLCSIKLPNTTKADIH